MKNNKKVRQAKHLRALSGSYDFTQDDSVTKFVSPDIAFDNIQYSPSDLQKLPSLVSLGTAGEVYLRKDALAALMKMSEGFYGQFHTKIKVVSGYRSYDFQANIERRASECVRD